MKHDDIINEIYSKLLGEKLYNYEYSIGKKHGECDLFSYYNDNLYIFEVKTTNNKKHRQKALEQLERDYKYFSNYYPFKRCWLFYVYSHGCSYRIELINKVEDLGDLVASYYRGDS